MTGPVPLDLLESVELLAESNATLDGFPLLSLPGSPLLLLLREALFLRQELFGLRLSTLSYRLDIIIPLRTQRGLLRLDGGLSGSLLLHFLLLKLITVDKNNEQRSV